MTAVLGLDIGTNSVGSAWVDTDKKEIRVGVSVFPAGVDESDEKRGDPKNVKRRTTRRARITLARRAERKRRLRRKLIAVALLPKHAAEFKTLLEETDPWVLRRRGLTETLTPYEFGRILLHLAQRRGALGFDAEVGDTGKVKGAIIHVQLAILGRYATEDSKERVEELHAHLEILSKKKNRTDQEDEALESAQQELKTLCRTLLQDSSVSFGRFIADERDDRRTPITSFDRRKSKRGVREWRKAVRNRAGQFEFHADRAMIRDEFAKLWNAQKRMDGPLAKLLTDELRLALDNDAHDSDWRHKGLLFGQRALSWDLGTLGRCVLEPTERCAPHADMYVSRYLVVETINNLKIIESGKKPRSLTKDERQKIKTYLSGPFAKESSGTGKGKGSTRGTADRIKTTVSVTDLRNLMGTSEQGWGRGTKTSRFRFNIEADENRNINTDWFSREIIHGAVTLEKWEGMTDGAREGINRAILQFDPDEEGDASELKQLVMRPWAALSEGEATALIAAWKKRPRPDAKRLNMSRRAVRNLLTVMDREEPWPDSERPGEFRWLTQIEARKLVGDDKTFRDIVTGEPLDEHARRRYQTGAKGGTARDRHYMRKHLLFKNGKLVFGPNGQPLREPPPAPLISNPVVRKAIHEVRRHLVEYMKTFERLPDEIYVELAREAKMGKMDSDRVLFRNRLRNRIRNDIIREFELANRRSTQQRAAVERVILCVQQDEICPLCGQKGLTRRKAALGEDCEVAHILPKGGGGNNGLGNLVLAHIKCNRDMARRTPRRFWDETVKGGFDEAISWIERMYHDIKRPTYSEIKDASGPALWQCYFTSRDDMSKIEQFKKDIKDIQTMTERQEAATKYATRQVMTYLADALFDGKGLPERGGERRIFATDGLWTSRLRREWGLFFDPHKFRGKGLSNADEQERKEKDRGDHRHHAIDAVVIALSTPQVRREWEERERNADTLGVNTADEEAMEAHRKNHRLPTPFDNEGIDFRESVRRAIYTVSEDERPVCHRPVKRKLIGALHEETLFGPALDHRGAFTGNYTAKKSVLQLDPNHLRLPAPEGRDEAIKRLADEFKTQGMKAAQAKQRAEQVLNDPNYTPRMIDPSPGKSGIVRDLALRKRIRECLSSYKYTKKNKAGQPIGDGVSIDPDDFSDNEIKQAFEDGAICHASKVPIRSVVLLRTMSDPVITSRWATDYQTGKRYRLYDAGTGSGDCAAARAYVGGNNHHIEIRVDKREKWSGTVVPAYTVAQQKLAKLRAIRAAKIPKRAAMRKLPNSEREAVRAKLRAIEQAHPFVDRSDDEAKGGKFVMSLCEGEMLMMRRKAKKGETPGDVGYFVVAKLDKPQSIVLVPHWDARSATERKDAEGQKVPNSKREQFAVTPSDLKDLAPPDHPHAVKVRVSPLGKVTHIQLD